MFVYVCICMCRLNSQNEIFLSLFFILFQFYFISVPPLTNIAFRQTEKHWPLALEMSFETELMAKFCTWHRHQGLVTQTWTEAAKPTVKAKAYRCDYNFACLSNSILLPSPCFKDMRQNYPTILGSCLCTAMFTNVVHFHTLSLVCGIHGCHWSHCYVSIPYSQLYRMILGREGFELDFRRKINCVCSQNSPIFISVKKNNHRIEKFNI